MEDQQPRGTATLPSPRNPSEKRSSTPGALRPPSLRLQHPRSAVNQVIVTGEVDIHDERESVEREGESWLSSGHTYIQNIKILHIAIERAGTTVVSRF